MRTIPGRKNGQVSGSMLFGVVSVLIVQGCVGQVGWGGFQSASDAQCLHPDTNQSVAAGTTYAYYTLARGTEAECSAARTTATCEAATRTFVPSPAASRYLSCTDSTLPTWNMPPLSFTAGSSGTVSIGQFLPPGTEPGGSFSVGPSSASLPPGMQLTGDGVLSVGSAAVGTVEGVVFSYTSRTTITSNPTSIHVVEPQPVNDGVFATQPFNDTFAVVYVRIPRTVGGTTQADGAAPSVAISGQFDRFPEISHWVSGMSGPGQLVYRDRSGSETVLFDCINQTHVPIVAGSPAQVGPLPCLPMDPTVSFDGRKVVFSVLYSAFANSNYENQTFANGSAVMTKKSSSPIGAQLFEADLTNFTVRALDYRALGDFDTAPVYIPWDESNPADTDRIMFTSNRARELPSSLLFSSRPADAFNQHLLQLYIADNDAKNARRVGVHDRDGVLHPFTMSDGRVLLTTWSLSHMGAYRRNNGATRSGASPENESWLASVDSKGGTFHADYGRHGKYWVDSNSNAHSSVGLHFLTESADKRWLCATDYYRGNNMGGGMTRCFQREPTGVEGRYIASPAEPFMPQFIKSAFTFGNNSDTNDAVGATRDAVALPGNHFLVTWLRGNACMRPDSARSAYADNTCDGGIYRTTAFPAAAPNMLKIADDPNYHEFMPRVAEPYSFVYGIPKPRFSRHRLSPNGKCYIGSSSMEAEVEPLSSYSFNGKGLSSRDCAVQGCKARAIELDQVAAIRFWEVLPNDESSLHRSPEYADSGQPNFLKSMAGNRLRLLGDAPLAADRSFVAELPCETPYVMAGVTADGEVVLRDQVPQSLRQGEVRTCTGCHLHSGAPGPAFDTSASGIELNNHFGNQSSAVTLISATGGFKEIWNGELQTQVTVDNVGAVTAASNEGQVYEYFKHIVPIMNASCVSCHGAGSVLDLREMGTSSNFFAEVAASHEQSAYMPTALWNKITNEQPSGGGDWEIPRLSRYMHMGFALESLFYWKAAGQRMDGRTDTSVAGDLDYGPNGSDDPHKNLNPNHVRIIKNWLDSGAYLHQGVLPMTYKPTGG